LQTAQKQERSSVQDNNDTNTIDNSFIEFGIISLFQIDIMNYIKVKAVFAKEFHIPPSELDNMPAWEYDLFINEVNQLIKEENERNQSEMDKSGIKDAKKMSDPKYAQRQSRKYASGFKTPSTPSMGSFKMPSMPKL
jgi:hypothetical protein